MVWLIYQMYGVAQSILVAFVYGGTLLSLLNWSYTFDATAIIDNYRRVMHITFVTSLGFMGFLILHILGLL